MIQKYAQATRKAAKEARYWSYAAWTLPFVALSALVFEHFIGHNDWIEKTLWAISTVFFAISVFWWWWAINKIVAIMSAFKDNEDRFVKVVDELEKTRQTLREIDADNRKWREQITDRS